MEKETFLTDLQDLLQREEECKQGDLLDSYDEWDSLSKMSVLAYFDQKLGKKIDAEVLDSLKTVDDLVKLAGL